ncbi:MAG: hypothetical protein ABIP81_04125 [Terriglobales bacterium]
MGLFYVQEPVFISYNKLEASIVWYMENLGCRKPAKDEAQDDDGKPLENVLLLGDDYAGTVIFCGADVESPSTVPITVPIINTRKIEQAHRFLSERGVSCGAVQRDRSGRAYFEFRDLDDNVIEVCDED